MNKQNGATLAVSLIMLFLITVLGIGSIQSTHLQEKMAANMVNKSMSFAATESAVAAAELWILSLSLEPPVQTTCGTSNCVRTKMVSMNVLTAPETFWQTQTVPYTTSISDIPTAPRYYIEFIQFVPDTPEIGSVSSKNKGMFYYKITARGTGSNNESASIIQTTIARRF